MADLKSWMGSVGVNIELITNRLSDDRCRFVYSIVNVYFHSAPGLIGPFTLGSVNQYASSLIQRRRGGCRWFSNYKLGSSDQERVLYIALYNRNPHPNLTTWPQSVVPLLSQHIFDEKRLDDEGVVCQQRGYDPSLRKNKIGQKRGNARCKNISR